MKFWSKGIKVLYLELNTYKRLSEFVVKVEEWNLNENASIIFELIDLFSPK